MNMKLILEKGVDHVQPSIGRMTRMDDIIRIRDLAVKRELNSHPVEEYT